MFNNNTNNSVTDKTLLICLFNANGLKNHVHELETVLNNTRIDIVLITETHFTKYTSIHIPGYKRIKTNRPDNTAHGGVAIFIKSSIIFKLLPSFSHDHIQSSAILLNLNNIPISIAAFYSPPKHNITNSTFSEYFDTFKNNFIIGRDFNAKRQSWGCRTNNPWGLILYNFVTSKHFKVLASPGPIYWPTSTKKNPDIMDIFVSKIPNCLHYTTTNILDLNSEHSSVMLILNTTPPLWQGPPKVFNRTTDHKKFHNLVNEEIKLNTKLKTSADIDSAVNSLTTIIQSAAWSASNYDTNLLIHNPLPEIIRTKITQGQSVISMHAPPLT